MLKKSSVLFAAALLAAASPSFASDHDRSFVVTSSNSIDNQLLVFDTAGTLIQSAPTFGQGGAGSNAGGIAANNERVAVVNFGSQNVSVFSRGDQGLEFRQLVPVASQPLSVAFGSDHLYILGTTTVESHRLDGDGIEAAADGIAVLVEADGSAAQVGYVGDELIVTEKAGTIERVQLRDGAVVGSPVAVNVPAGRGDTPFGLVTRGNNAYVTVAASDLVAVVKDGSLTGFASTGTPGGAGQHSPCWIALVGPFLFTTNSPSHSVSRLVAGGRNVVLDAPVAAQTNGTPIDIAAAGDLLAVVELDGGGTSHLTQFRIDADGSLTPTASTAITGAANGVVIIPGN